jgi:vesicle-associated membrane protein 72
MFSNIEMTENKVIKVQSQVDDLKTVMLLNIEKAMERGETLVIIEEKSAILEEQSKRFERASSKLKWQERCRYVKMSVLVLVIIAVLIVIILAASGAFK